MSSLAFRQIDGAYCLMRAVFTFTILFAVLVFGAAREARGQAHDYFTAQANPGVKQYLTQVENNHLYKSPNNPRGLVGNIAEGKYPSAVGGLNYILERFPNHPRALELAGVLAKISKNTSLAIPYFENAVRSYPQYALTHAQYGKYLSEVNHIDEGITRLKKAIELDPKLVHSYVWLAKAFAKKGDMKLARETAEQARELGYKENILGDASQP
jgi:predicted Zn-dependent protease